jgi:hypothetical protein
VNILRIITLSISYTYLHTYIEDLRNVKRFVILDTNLL